MHQWSHPLLEVLLDAARGRLPDPDGTVEVLPPPGGRTAQGLGRALALAARHLVPAGEPVFAQVSPGNAASLRAILAAGYRPLGSEVLFVPASPAD
jgi:hypothetical protein